MHSTCALVRIYNQRMSAAHANTIDYDCGIAMARITHWLDCELGLPREGDSWTFSSGNRACTIQVQPLQSRTLGTVTLERTHFLAQGDAEAIEALRNLFTLRFMSAGG